MKRLQPRFEVSVLCGMSVKIEFVSQRVLSKKGEEDKLNFILNSVKKDKILVLEEPLSGEEEAKLIEKTMGAVSKDFPGIEMCTLGKVANDVRGVVIKILGGRSSGLTVVGPSNLVKQIKRDPHKLQLLAGK